MSDYVNSKNQVVLNAALLSLKSCEEKGKRSESASEVSDRFIHSVGQLSKNQGMEFRLECNQGKKNRTLVFASHDAEASTEDFRWIFAECTDSVEKISDLKDVLIQDKAAEYALYFLQGGEDALGRSRSFDFDEKFKFEEYFPQILEELEKTGSSIAFKAGQSTSGKLAGRVSIYATSPISLRLKTMVSFAFKNTKIEVAGESEGAGNRNIPPLYFKAFMAHALDFLMHGKAADAPEVNEKEATEDKPETGVEDEELPKTGKTPIAKLDLSVRSYNCLKRSGIDSVEKLLALSDEDICRIRNLGRKSFEEIRQRLSEVRNLPVPVKLEAPSYTDMLNNLIGLSEVKEQVKKVTAFAQMKRDMERLGKTDIPVVLNMEFVGNPGTAKTTVARIVAGILCELGLLSSNEIVEVGRADLIAKYLGQTADKVKSAFLHAKGKLLFIDEAYSLLDSHEGEYGDEAINTIVQEMENNRSDTIVVFAGYPNKMKAFFTRNPGLRSRVPFSINFSDYSEDEMVDIVELEAQKRGFGILPEGKGRVRALCKRGSSDPESGNGRFCRNLVESAVLAFALRTYGSGKDRVADEFVLTEEDFVLPSNLKEVKKAAPIGFRAKPSFPACKA